jgi:GntR family transcriptional regulator/MocR family aminotransferase
MRSFNLSLPRSNRPLYLRITDGLRDAIKSGMIMPGEKLPSCRTLAEQVGANRHTVMTALEQLIAEGWIYAETRKGYRVAEELPSKFFSPALSKMKPSTYTVSTTKRSLKPITPKWDFRSSTPDLRLFPLDEFKTCLNASLKREGPTILGYGESNGYRPFIHELEKYLRRVRALAGRELIVTHGSQEAIFIAAHVILSSGDGVAVEDRTYPAARTALSSTGASLYAVKTDDEGLDPEAFAKLCTKRRIKLLYLTPLHQYPTTVTLSSPRRHALYEVARKNGVMILEDDYDHEYHYRCQPLPPLAAEDPANIVIYVSTLSKILFPSARIGFMAAPQQLHAKFSEARKMISTQNDTLMQSAVARWMRSDGFQRHLNRTRRTYEKRLRSALSTLSELKALGAPINWITPDGGMAIWLKTPWDTEELAKVAAAESIIIQPESPTRMDGKRSSHIRLGFARHTEQEFASGMERLLKLAAKHHRHCSLKESQLGS